jgi:hypothetical protein
MKFLFYINIDKNFTDKYVSTNKSIMDFSNKYDLILLSSSYTKEELLKNYPNAIIIESENGFIQKHNDLYNYIDTNDIQFDWLVRLDMDEIVFDIEPNLELIRTYNPQEKIFMGRWSTSWIRGAFNVLSKAGYDSMKRPYDVKDPRFYKASDPVSIRGGWIDLINTVEAKNAGCKIINVNVTHPNQVLFWRTDQIPKGNYQDYPVVHPTKDKNIYQTFLKLLEMYNEKNCHSK